MVAIGRSTSIERAVRFDLIVDSTKPGELIAHCVELLRNSTPFEMARKRPVESFYLALCLGVTHAREDRADPLLEQQYLNTAESVRMTCRIPRRSMVH